MRLGFQISVTDIGCPSLQTVKFGEKEHDPKTAQGDNTGVDTVEGNIRKMAVHHHSSFMPAVMLHVENRMNSNLLVPFRWTYILTVVLESIVVGILVPRCRAKGLELRLVHHLQQLELLPTIDVQQIVISSIDSTGNDRNQGEPST